MSSAAVQLSDQAHLTSCETQARLEEYAPNYTRWIVSAARPYVGRRLLDVGCSTGNITSQFVDRDLIVGLDPNPYALQQARASWGNAAHVRLFEMGLPADNFDDLTGCNFDTVLCINVLEHVEDDVLALRQMATLLEPGGTLFLLVPANPWLYGSMDAADHHYRRYARSEVVRKVGAAGLSVHASWWMNFPGVAGWFVNGRILRRPLIPSVQAGLYDRVVPTIQRLEAALRPPVGQSLVVVAKR